MGSQGCCPQAVTKVLSAPEMMILLAFIEK